VGLSVFDSPLLKGESFMLLIKNGYIKTMAGADIPDGSVLIGDDGKILSVGENISAPEGAQVIDAEGRLVTPGCVEAHCHIGLGAEYLTSLLPGEHNESTDPLTPHLRAIDGLNPTDQALANAIAGGVTTACAGPGSANIIGGTFTAIKLHGHRVDDMVIKQAVAMKCAFGENPKNAHGKNNKKSPKTRMAIAAMLREFLFKARAYAEAKDEGKCPNFDMKLEAMEPVIRGELPLKIHAHRSDDIFTAIRIAKEFNLKIMLDHCTDGSVIAEDLAKEGYPVLVGPSFGKRSKEELKNKSFSTPAVLHKAGLKVCIISDANVVPLEYLPLYAGLAASEGMPLEEAWKAITINPAQVMGIADRVGSLEAGKDGDVVIWTANPLTTIGGKAHTTIIEGKVVYTL